MKRYGVLMALSFFVILSIGTYYSRSVASGLPEFTLAAKQGNEDMAKAVTLGGRYGNDSLRIDSKGVDYRIGESLLDQLDSYFWADSEIRRLVGEYRQFMRGKLSSASIYNGKSDLVYAEIRAVRNDYGEAESYNFEVEILDKGKDQRFSYELPVPDGNLYQFIDVIDVQVFDNKIVAIARALKASDTNEDQTEYFRYTLGLNKAELLSSETIQFPENTPVGALQLANQADKTDPAMFKVFYQLRMGTPEKQSENAHNDSDTNGHQTLSIADIQVIAYDTESGQMKPIHSQTWGDYLKKQTDVSNVIMSMDGEKLYMILQRSSDIRVIEYDIGQGNENVYDYQVGLLMASEVVDGRLYLVARPVPFQPGEFLVDIIDLESNQIVYKGAVELEESGDVQKEALQKLMINQIEVDQGAAEQE